MTPVALVLIDVQVGMFDPAGPVHAGDELLETLSDLVARARAARAPVVYVQHCGSAASGLEQGSPGWSIHPRLAALPGDIHIVKTEPDSFQGTSLDELLRECGVTTLVVGGIATEYCVDATVRSAYARGYRVVLAADGHGTWGTDMLTADQIVAHHNRTLQRFGEVRPASEVKFERH